LFHRFDLIARHPELGASRPEFSGGELRIHSVGSYAIVYRTVDGGVEIARVLHGARDLNSLL
jgi:toxin ParE1/3/4